MRTTKPISTISFNTPKYLAVKLDELLKSGRLSFWAFIPHKPEDDEGGNKPHCHVYCEPAKMLQTEDLKSELKEFDPTKPDKPLGCISWRSSKFAEWYLYGLHDKRYLASKGQSRRFHYVHDEMLTSDADELLCRSREIDLVSLSPYADMEDAISHGLTFAEYFSRGTIPLPQLAAFQKAWDLLSDLRTNRNCRPGHPMSLDSETGEVIEAPQSVDNPTWCGATHDEWKELYESATTIDEPIVPPWKPLQNALQAAENVSEWEEVTDEDNPFKA